MCSQQSVTQEDKVMPITVRGCDRLAHISHIPYKVDLSHLHYSVFSAVSVQHVSQTRPTGRLKQRGRADGAKRQCTSPKTQASTD
jgi:hypothetical protein